MKKAETFTRPLHIGCKKRKFTFNKSIHKTGADRRMWTCIPSLGGHCWVSSTLKYLSCAYRSVIAVICRIQTLPLSPPLPSQSVKVLLLVRANAGLPWPSLSAGWRSPSYSGWPYEHVANLGTADSQLSGVAKGGWTGGRALRWKRTENWRKCVQEILNATS